jgi:DNA-binding winged helix-turn-helix (wHTH) protein/tetratricopeptide (TPR) repeat protein/TolB-like protein
VSDSAGRGSPDFFEFGPFQLDVTKRVLHRQGEYVVVTPKALETLLVLVEEAGHLVTREQLLARVWPDASVEEGSLSNTISTLRKILNPHFEGDGPIATVARRGYRFTAAVRLRAVGADIALASPVPAAVPVPAPGRRRVPWWWYAAAAGVIVAVATIARFTTRPPPTAPALRRSVAVLAMHNLSREGQHAWLSTALMETISAELAAGGHLRLISGENVAQMQQELSPPPGVRLTRAQLAAIGRNLGCDLILTGNYLWIGGKVRVDVRFDDVASGEPVASLTVTDNEKNLVDLVGRVNSEVRAKLGIEAPPASQLEAVRASLSSDPEALRAYFLGVEALRRHDGERARDLLTQAVTVDPDFALAHSALSITWRVMGYDLRASEEGRRAAALAGRLSREDRLSVEGAYYEVSSNWPKAIENYQSLWNSFPDNIAYGLKLVNVQLLGGRLADARRAVDQLRRLPPPADGDPRVDLVGGDLSFRLGDLRGAFASAARAADKAAAKKADLLLATARLRQGNYAQRLGDSDRARHYFAEAKPIFETFHESAGVAEALRMDAEVLLARNRLDEAAAQLAAALKLTQEINYLRLSTEILIIQSALARQQRHAQRASADAETALAAARAADTKSAIARALNALGGALALQGDYENARRRFAESVSLARDIGERPVYVNAVNNAAGLDLAQGRLTDARRALETILPVVREIGDRASLAACLANLSALSAMQGDVVNAAQMNGEACQIHEALGAKATLASCGTKAAAFEWQLGRPAGARAAAERVSLGDLDASAQSPADLARLATVYGALGDRQKAAAALGRAQRALDDREYIPAHAIAVAIAAGRLDRASGRSAATVERLEHARSEAMRFGLTPCVFEARLALAEQADGARRAASLAELAKDATQAGFGLIALEVARLAAAVAGPPRPRSLQ